MIKIGVCDDVAFFVEAIVSAVEIWSACSHMQVQIKKFLSGEELLCDAEQTGEFAAVFLDIELKGINGMETAARLRDMYRYTNIIFVSQYDSYFKQMLRLHPCYFLEKPVRRRKVFEILDRIADENKYLYATFQFRYRRIVYSIFLRQVIYFASEKRMIHIVMENQKEYVFYNKLDDVARKLSECDLDFIRIHKSFLVNSRHVEQYHYDHICMSNAERLPVSRECRSRVSRYHMKLLQEL